jgi:DNA-directed RNA polymerase specialized sigma24 family protein
MITSRQSDDLIVQAKTDRQAFQSIVEDHHGLMVVAARRAARSDWLRLSDEAMAGALEGLWMAVCRFNPGDDFSRLAFIECYRAARRQVRSLLPRRPVQEIDSDPADRSSSTIGIHELSHQDVVELLASGESITSAARILGLTRNQMNTRIRQLRKEIGGNPDPFG